METAATPFTATFKLYFLCRQNNVILTNFLSLVKACIEELNHKSNRVIHINVGNPGAGSDGGVFWEDNIGMALRGNKLGVFWDDNIGNRHGPKREQTRRILGG